MLLNLDRKENGMRIIIAGSKGFTNYKYIKDKTDDVINYYIEQGVDRSDIIIISGTAKGVDQLGEYYAKENGYALERYPADLSLGNKAGPIRNRQMAEKSDVCIVFWDGSSPGSMNMYKTAQVLKLDTYLFNFYEDIEYRLNSAKTVIEKAYMTHDLQLLFQCIKNFKELYAACYSERIEGGELQNNNYYLANYLKYLLAAATISHFEYESNQNNIYKLVDYYADKIGIASVLNH